MALNLHLPFTRRQPSDALPGVPESGDFLMPEPKPEFGLGDIVRWTFPNGKRVHGIVADLYEVDGSNWLTVYYRYNGLEVMDNQPIDAYRLVSKAKTAAIATASA